MFLSSNFHGAKFRGVVGILALAGAGHAAMGAATEVGKLLASDGVAGDSFGRTVAIDGDVAIVGAPDNGAGAAYIYRFDGVGWAEEAVLTAADGENGDQFGIAADVSGDVAIVGAWQDVDGAFSSGSAYVYRFDGASWSEEAKLLASDRAATDQFGVAVAIDGNVAVVGAERGDDLLTPVDDSGAAYVFEYGGGWSETAKLFASDAAVNDRFGNAVDIDGDVIVVGARSGDAVVADTGAAYVFAFDGSDWFEEAKLTAADGAAADEFGGSVAISADTVICGAPLDDDVISASGSAYAFTFNGSSWTQQAKLVAGDAAQGDNFGDAVAIAGDLAIVGAFLESAETGSIYVFRRAAGAWSQDVKLLASDATAPDQFGGAVGVSAEQRVIVGAAGDDDLGNASGSAYVFELLDTDGDDLTDYEETVTLAGTYPCLDPYEFDSDGDGIDDGTELSISFYDPCDPGGAPIDTDGDGIGDGRETLLYGTDPLDADSDDDGLTDGDEVAAAAGTGCPDPLDDDSDDDGLLDGSDPDPCVPGGPVDTDGDGLTDNDETTVYGTDPDDADTDDDGLIDGDEVLTYLTDPLDADSDDDGLGDGEEIATHLTDPLDADSDDDGLLDGEEVLTFATDPLDADSDDDDLTDGEEINEYGTDPLVVDTDGDGLTDGEEVALAGFAGCPNPVLSDSDSDGLTDGEEVVAGLDPCDADFDDDGLSDGNEALFGTDPENPDTDGDGLTDGEEVDAAMGTGCPDPLAFDSDGDTLSDGEEVDLTTDPCNVDTDGDGVEDDIDPLPVEPGVPDDFLAEWTMDVSTDIRGLDLPLFTGPSDFSKRVRRTILSGLTSFAAMLIEFGYDDFASVYLTIVYRRVDGASPPRDWIVDSPEKTDLADEIDLLIDLLAFE
ncbi:MAG: hypothetical protein SYC29_14090 [Planctomycetota bacterium]|nr:hypothetical protein [Planctomycetota bacterium]